MFDPDRQMRRGRGGWREPFLDQWRFYDPGLSRELSDRVAWHMAEELDLSGVIALARQNFRDVRFIAVSALGAPPLPAEEAGASPRLVREPRPRRVEEPLLWVLHRWGFL